jgi:hypothetical protein
VKYSVQENDESPHPDIVQSSGVKRRNAFEILMTSQRSLQCKTLPDPVQEKNKKDKLYINILSLLELKKLKVEYSEIQRFGDRLVRALCDTLWYIDGHHDVFRQRAIVIPSVFNPFQGYNCPEKTKHRKRQLTNMASDQLHHLASELLTLLQANYWEREYWREFKGDVAGLMQSLVGYTEYLSQKNKKVKHCHVLTTPVRELSSNLRLKFIPASTITQASISATTIEEAMRSKSNFEYQFITDLLPSNPVQKYCTIESLTSDAGGFTFHCVLLVYTPGSNIGNQHFLWKVPVDCGTVFEQSQVVIEKVKALIPQYHTRAMRTAMFEKFGRISPSIKPSSLRYFYKELTGDESAASTTEQADVDKRIKQIIDMEDPNVLPDLRELNTGRSAKFNTFWEECAKFLNEDVGNAVDDRRHGQITHLARAISIRDLVEQVKTRCANGTLIPSVEWTKLQF